MFFTSIFHSRHHRWSTRSAAANGPKPSNTCWILVIVWQMVEFYLKIGTPTTWASIRATSASFMSIYSTFKLSQLPKIFGRFMNNKLIICSLNCWEKNPEDITLKTDNFHIKGTTHSPQSSICNSTATLWASWAKIHSLGHRMWRVPIMGVLAIRQTWEDRSRTGKKLSRMRKYWKTS